jgi:NADH dehydrogenase FAD-containing subunit
MALMSGDHRPRVEIIGAGFGGLSAAKAVAGSPFDVRSTGTIMSVSAAPLPGREPDLSLPGNPDIFVVGDAAHLADAEGKLLPGVAPVAKQQGRYVARLPVARARGTTTPPFRYRDFGALATIGRKGAVVQIGRLKLSGVVAWLIWSEAHIYFLIGFRNRLIVALNWAWSYATFQRGTRLITGFVGFSRGGYTAAGAESFSGTLARCCLRTPTMLQSSARTC